MTDSQEVCPKCKSNSFAIVRDMTSRRICKCGHQWLPPSNQADTAKPPVVLAKELSQKLEFAEGFLMIAKFNDHIEVVTKTDLFMFAGLMEILKDHLRGTKIIQNK